MMTRTFKTTSLFSPSQSIQTWLALFLAVGLAATVGTALGFEHIGGFMPCELCLTERIPYYIGAPLMLIAAFFSAKRFPGFIIRILFIIVFLLMAYDCAISIYHTGAEYGFWPGPSACASSSVRIVENANDLLNSLSGITPPACDRAAGYFLGLSFAGWNVVATFFFAVISLISAFIARKK